MIRTILLGRDTEDQKSIFMLLHVYAGETSQQQHDLPLSAPLGLKVPSVQQSVPHSALSVDTGLFCV